MKTKEDYLLQILNTKTVEDAEKIIKKLSWNRIPPEDIFGDKRICNHLAWLFYKLKSPVQTGNRQEDMKKELDWQTKYYEAGKRIYGMAVSINGKGSLIIAPLLMIWYERFLTNRVSCRNPQSDYYLPDDELIGLSRIIAGSIKDTIDDSYWKRARKEWLNDPEKISQLKSQTD